MVLKGIWLLYFLLCHFLNDFRTGNRHTCWKTTLDLSSPTTYFCHGNRTQHMFYSALFFFYTFFFFFVNWEFGKQYARIYNQGESHFTLQWERQKKEPSTQNSEQPKSFQGFLIWKVKREIYS